MIRKPILCLDFDGVIHDYKEGWKDGTIYGHATKGFFPWALDAVNFFHIVIYSSRSKTPEGRQAMGEWLGRESVLAIERGEVATDYDWSNLFGDIEYAHEKPPAFLTIDDRAIQFRGSWYELDPAMLVHFQPWNKGKGDIS